jgi:hypothetical protein
MDEPFIPLGQGRRERGEESIYQAECATNKIADIFLYIERIDAMDCG